ncbi:MAG: hypothetical protein JWP14_3397 [Frankiales bacterium]|nr:hypothetical protein [Frankiales bacterium]
MADPNAAASVAQDEVTDEHAARVERGRAHLKHGESSMEELPVTDLTRLTVLVEEVGEVARAFNEWRHTGTLDRLGLRSELIQVAAMAGAWADALGRCSTCGLSYDEPPCSRNPATGQGFHTVFGGVGVAQADGSAEAGEPHV